MKILELENNFNLENETNFDPNDLLNYLSETVLSMIDEEIRTEKTKMNNLNKSIKHINDAFKEVKKSYENKTSELAKEKQLKRVLTRIETLNKEGSLRGQRKTSIIEILPKLKKYSFSNLSKLEERLSIY